MKKDAIYKIYINKDLYFEVLYDGQKIKLIDAGNVPSKSIKIVNLSTAAYITIGEIPYMNIDLLTGDILNTSSNVLTTYVRNYSQLEKEKDPSTKIEHILNERTFISNERSSILRKNKNVKNILELHTHFMEVLSGEEFFNLVKDKITFMDFDADENLVNRYLFDKENPTKIEIGYNRYSISAVCSNNQLYNKVIKSLSIDTDRQVDFGEISKVLNRRLALIELVSYHQTLKEANWLEKTKEGKWKQKIADVRANARIDFYFEMLRASLETLKKQGVKYVEFSYSTAGMIAKMVDRINNSEPIEGINFNFLYSVHRTKRLATYRKGVLGSDKSSDRNCLETILPNLIEEGLVTGFDLMGMEKEITVSDMLPSIGDRTGTLYDKIYTAFEILSRYPNKDLTLRLHAGELPYDKTLDLEDIMIERNNNPLKTLQILDLIVYRMNVERRKQNLSELVVPPPNIRIGHGLHFKKTDEYVKLLKKYKVIVEINASSNFALNNIKNLNELPYNWYLDNGIPIVLSTDGGGFYLTTPLAEMKMAEIFGGRSVARDVEETNEEFYLNKIGGFK